MENERVKKKWVLRGLLWGSFMFLTLTIVIPLMDGVQMVAANLMSKLVVWLALGLAYGYIVHLIEKQKEN